MHLSGVDIFVVTACALPQARVFNQLFVLHCCLQTHTTQTNRQLTASKQITLRDSVTLGPLWVAIGLTTYPLGPSARYNVVEDWLLLSHFVAISIFNV